MTDLERLGRHVGEVREVEAHIQFAAARDFDAIYTSVLARHLTSAKPWYDQFLDRNAAWLDILAGR
jgi:hypothetical protein